MPVSSSSSSSRLKSVTSSVAAIPPTRTVSAPVAGTATSVGTVTDRHRAVEHGDLQHALVARVDPRHVVDERAGDRRPRRGGARRHHAGRRHEPRAGRERRRGLAAADHDALRALLARCGAARSRSAGRSSPGTRRASAGARSPTSPGTTPGSARPRRRRSRCRRSRPARAGRPAAVPMSTVTFSRLPVWIRSSAMPLWFTPSSTVTARLAHARIENTSSSGSAGVLFGSAIWTIAAIT